MPPKFYSALHYDGSVCYTEGGDEPVLRKLKINCPICKREFSALLSKFTKFERVSNTVSEEEPSAIYRVYVSNLGGVMVRSPIVPLTMIVVVPPPPPPPPSVETAAVIVKDNAELVVLTLSLASVIV